MSDDSDTEIFNKRTPTFRRAEDSPDSPNNSSSSSTSSSGPIGTTSRKRLFLSDDSDSDSGSSIEVVVPRWRRKVPRVESDADSDSSGSIIIKRNKRPGRVVSESEDESEDTDHGFEENSVSQWETDFCSQDEARNDNKSQVVTAVKLQDTGVDSDSSDGESDKCPICLLSLKNQEIGIPESCDHMFCAECIQEWSKNVNTCPVDRQEYRLILIRKNVNGGICNRIPIEPPNPQNEVEEIFEDPTFCEICGSSDREDRMLLCDGCDLGFHLECLTPPLQDIPMGSWYCNDCGTGNPEEEIDEHIEMVEVQMLFDEAGPIVSSGTRRRTTSPRLVPRTRHVERVRRRIATNRNNSNRRAGTNGPELVVAGNSREVAPDVSSTTSRVRRKKTKKRTRKKAVYYEIVYEVDEATGETIAVKKKRSRRRRARRRTRRERRENPRPKTVKKRLALQLGICAPRTVPQNLPDVRVQPQTRNLGLQRQQAGIPTLHLFGRRHELDYFSASDEEVDGSDGVLIRRASNRSNLSVFRRAARVKSVPLPNSVSSTTDLLGSILDSQTKFHSKNTIFSLDRDGKFNMERSDRVRFDSYNQYVRCIPTTSSDSTSTSNNNSDSIPSSSKNDYQTNSSSPEYSNSTPTSTVETNNANSAAVGNSNEQYAVQDYSQRTLNATYDVNKDDRKDKKTKNADDAASDNNTPRSNTPCSDSEIDIYSDIETVSTSKVEDSDFKPPSPLPISHTPNTGTDDDNDSEPDMVIDTDKVNNESEENREEAAVSSTVDSNSEVSPVERPVASAAHSTFEIQSEAVQSSTSQEYKDQFNSKKVDDEDDESEDECPNFSIYSKESITLAKNTDISLDANLNDAQQNDQIGEISSSPLVNAASSAEVAEVADSIVPEGASYISTESPQKNRSQNTGLYSDSEDETIVKKDTNNSFAISDIRNMTEDISEEERSYTPCLDERIPVGGGLEGLDTEMISDEDRNDFDESHDLKTVSDGDALEINAKESELDFTRPEDYEEGEIIDKSKGKKADDNKDKTSDDSKKSTKADEKKSDKDKDPPPSTKENESQSNKDSSFKKLSRSNKERNYRDKDREHSKSPEIKGDKATKRELKKKEKRKEIKRYDVRALIAEKPRRLKDKFGRDIRRSKTRSRSKSQTPAARRSLSRERRSLSRARRSRSQSKGRRSLSKSRRSRSRSRRSLSRDWSRKKRGRSRTRRSLSRSKTRSPERKRSKTRKRKRSASKNKSKRKKSVERAKAKKKRSRSRFRSRSLSPNKRRKDWNRRSSRGWTPSSFSRSRTPEPKQLTPSWTPPRVVESPVKPHNLTVILPNNAAKKKKEKRKKAEKKAKENERQKKRRRIERTPPPSKEVFASGDNILVSVSFNKENETRDVSTKRKKDAEELAAKKKKDKRNKNRLRNKQRDLSGIKPVAIIDLERSPFKELTPSPKDVIVLSDSDNEQNGGPARNQNGLCDSSQQVASPEINSYLTGPKTPPEPQVKFTLTSKPLQIRAISNPLHEPEDIEPEGDTQEVADQTLHKGPNTPPEPPNSPPSSPDAYDPFEPTKSRSPTPEPLQTTQSNSTLNLDDNRDDSMIEIRSGMSDLMDKSSASINQTPDPVKSHTPPLADVQPADSQSSNHATPESNVTKSPERSVVSIQSTATSSASFTVATTKPVAQTIPFSSAPTLAITSTPISSNIPPTRINILNSTIITPSTMPNRIVLPNAVKSSPVKISPTKAAVKSTPIKPMPSKIAKSARKSAPNRNQNGSDGNDNNLSFDSPYSPGSSDYEDLFEPPAESAPKPATKSATKQATKSPVKAQNAFDALFGSSPFNKIKTKPDKTTKFNKKPSTNKGKGTKQIGVKIDEDNLKILDELPNSAVEMQVKDKFLKKLNRQERVVEEVKLVLKPHYNKKHVNKEEYKDILRRAVPKICHNKSGEINPTKIKNLIEAYVKKIRHSKKVTSSSSVNNPQKT